MSKLYRAQRKAACQNWGEKSENTCDFCMYKEVCCRKRNMEGLRKGYKPSISAVFLLDIWTLVFKTSSERDYIISLENLFQHLFQTIRNVMKSLI